MCSNELLLSVSLFLNLSLLFLFQMDLECLDPRGRTPLHLAVTLGHLDCARLLLQQGADVSKKNHNGWTGECVTLHTPKLFRSPFMCCL